MQKINHISVLISTRNAERYIDRCIQSALSQDYPDFEVMFFDACSTDATFELAKQYESDHRIKIMQNEKRKYQGENLLVGTRMAAEKSIIVTLDGDDWFAHKNVLSRVNSEYVKRGCLMTHGSYAEYHGEGIPLRETHWHYKPFPEEVISGKSFRQYRWNSSHLRTWRRELFLKINESDMKDELTGDFVAYAPDTSFMFCLLELAGKRVRFIPDVLYIYNMENANNESKQNQLEIDRIEKQMRSKMPYPTLEKLYDDE